MIKQKKIQAVIFGPQGCGKGTQGLLLSDRLEVPLVGAGELFRAEIAEGTLLGNIVKEYVEHGNLAPDEVVNAVMAHRLKELPLSRGFILDGYPRNVEQAATLDRLLKINLAICIKISDKEALRRLEGRRQCMQCKFVYQVVDSPPAKPGICSVCGGKLVRRDDDNAEAIVRRLAAYHFMTEPLAAYYRQRGVLLTVNGEQAIPYVFEDLIKKMGKLGFQV